MVLADYLKLTSQSLRAFASQIGITPQGVHKYVIKERIPRPEIMAKIVAATKGAVGPADFYEASK